MMNVTHRYAFGSDTGSDEFSSYQGLCMDSFGPFRYRGNDSVFQSETVQFQIDTIAKEFRNIDFLSVLNNNMISPCVFNYGGYQELDAVLDSVPYIDSSGMLLARGNFPLKLYFIAQVQCAISNHQGLTGFCEDSESTEADTVSIAIIPKGYLNVTQDAIMPEKPWISIRQQGSELLISSFRISEDVRTFKIYDLLGRNAAMIEVPSGAEFVESSTTSLIPGCYFARLGDQMAKFVVPPR